MTTDPDDRPPECGWPLSTDELEEHLASASLDAGEPTGWFEALYSAGEAGQVALPWSRREAHPLLSEWAGARHFDVADQRAVVVGCGLGADAEHISSLGFQTHAFDISPTAIRVARQRHSSSSVDYQTADLLDPPTGWARSFDLVVEIITVQALPDPLRRQAIVNVGRLVRPRRHTARDRRRAKAGRYQVQSCHPGHWNGTRSTRSHRRARHCRDRTAYPPRRARRAAVASRVPPPYQRGGDVALSRDPKDES